MSLNFGVSFSKRCLLFKMCFLFTKNCFLFKMCFLFKKVFPFQWFTTTPKFRDIQGGLSFLPELVRDHTKIQGHTGGSFFFTRIGSRPYQNSGTYRRFFFFTRIGSRPYQNSGTYRVVFLFHQNWFATLPKFLEKKKI